MTVNVRTLRTGDTGHATARIQRDNQLARRVAIHHQAAQIADSVHAIGDPTAGQTLARSLARLIGETGAPASRAELVALMGYLTAAVEVLDQEAAR